MEGQRAGRDRAVTDPQLDHAVQQLTLGLLVDTYGLLRQAWWASLRVQECADDAPWNTWHDDDDPRGEARDLTRSRR